jgi:hypothetical protein
MAMMLLSGTLVEQANWQIRPCSITALLTLLLLLLLQMKQQRRDIAELLRAGKQDYARIRVEAVIREAFTLTGAPQLRACLATVLAAAGCSCNSL